MGMAAYNVPGTYQATDTNYFYVPAGKTYAITTAFFSNRHATVDCALSVWVTDESPSTIYNNGQPNDKYLYIKELQIPATDTYINDTQRMILEAGWGFYWIADTTNRVNAIISYMEI